jgi:hypothetical protein
MQPCRIDCVRPAAFVLAIAIAPAALGFHASLAFAQQPAPATTDDGSAARQFEEGQRAFAAGDFRRAAAAFESAYRLKPHHAPLWNAGRSWDKAGETVNAANFYSRFLAAAPAGARERDQATERLRELAQKVARLDIQVSDAKAVKLDGEAPPATSVYVAPGDHVVEGAAPSGEPVRRTVTVGAGQILSVALEPAPTRAEAAPPAMARGTQPTEKPSFEGPPRPEPDRGFHLPWPVVVIGGALTIVAGGLATWSGLSTLDQRDAFDTAPTQDKLDDGKSAQLRTNILIGTTIGLAVLTGVSALFVNWKGSSATAHARGRFQGVTR